MISKIKNLKKIIQSNKSKHWLKNVKNVLLPFRIVKTNVTVLTLREDETSKPKSACPAVIFSSLLSAPTVNGS